MLLRMTFTIEAETYGEAAQKASDVITKFGPPYTDFSGDGLELDARPITSTRLDDGTTTIVSWEIDVSYGTH